MDARLITLGGAALLGLVAGATLWALSGGQAQGEALEALDGRLSALPVRARPRLDRPSDALAQSLAAPLFATGGAATPAQVNDVAVQVFGLARSPVRVAALLSISGAPAQWWTVGETREGVTLRRVTSSGATIATLFGEREVTLGMPLAGTDLAPPGGPPPGFKSPPPPASAPQTAQ